MIMSWFYKNFKLRIEKKNAFTYSSLGVNLGFDFQMVIMSGKLKSKVSYLANTYFLHCRTVKKF